MNCKVDDKHMDIQNIGLPATNYGQSWRYKDLQKVSYEFTMPIKEFINKTDEWFSTYRTESIADSRIELKGEHPLQDKYKENGFPVLEEMMKNQHELLAGIIIFFDLDILNLFSGSSSKANKEDRYLINSLDWVEIENSILFGGEAFLIKS